MEHEVEDRYGIGALFDAIGDAEWSRLDGDLAGRVAFEIHRRFLGRYLTAGDRVLEIGAGPGRFTIVLGELGCTVVATDLSEVQVELNAQRVTATGAEHHVEEWCRLDVRDLSRFEDGAFDAVVAFGGPLSYVFDDAPSALSECLRVTKPDGVVLASVMGLPGSGRRFVESFGPAIEVVGLDAFDAFLEHGDQRVLAEVPGIHPCRLFAWSDVCSLVSAAGGELAGGAASNWLSLEDESKIVHFEQDPNVWGRFLDWEERWCSEPGALDGGTHTLFAARHPESDTEFA